MKSFFIALGLILFCFEPFKWAPTFFAEAKPIGKEDKAASKKIIKRGKYNRDLSTKRQISSLKFKKALKQASSIKSEPKYLLKVLKERDKVREQRQRIRGIKLYFHKLPSRRENRLIAKRLRLYGLRRTAIIPRFKMMLFKPSSQTIPRWAGERICENSLQNIPQLKICEPGILVLPADEHSRLLGGESQTAFLSLFSTKLEFFIPLFNLRAILDPAKKVGQSLREFLDNKIQKGGNYGQQNRGEKKPVGRRYLMAAYKRLADEEGGAEKEEINTESDRNRDEEETEASFSFNCPSCQPSEDLPVPIHLDIRACNIVSAERGLKKGQLSDYWAQELIGGDLLREELEGQPPPEAQHFISVLDLPLEKHDLQVKNLISDEGDQAILPELRDKISIININQNQEDGWNKLQTSPPSFINSSTTWVYALYQMFQSLPDTVIVHASGNGFPRVSEKEREYAIELNALQVGSFSPDGFVSHFSQGGEEVAILAPSDTYITSAVNGEYSRFGGTSGAAPLVTATLAGFEWLSGYHPTREEVKTLLEKSAIPIPNSHEEPQKNGKGLLNSYKISQIALRLKEKCSTQPPSCFQQEIANEENYHFSPAEGLEEEIEEAFPSCSLSGSSDGSPADCDKKAKVFKKLKKQVLLSPKRRELWESLSCIYREAGFLENSGMLDRIALATGSKEELLEDLKSLLFSEPWRGGLMRTLSNLMEPEERAKVFSELYSQINGRGDLSKTKSDWIDVALSIGGSEGMGMLALSAEDEGLSTKRMTALALGKVNGGEEKALEILKTLAEDEPQITEVVARSISRLGDLRGVAVMEGLIQKADPETSANVSEHYYELLTQLLAKETNIEAEQAEGRVREAAASSLGLSHEELYEKAVQVGVFSSYHSNRHNDIGYKRAREFLSQEIISSSLKMGERGMEILQYISENHRNSDIKKEAKKALQRLRNSS